MKRFTPAAVIALSLLNSLLAPPTAFARPAAPPAQQTPQPRYNFAAIHLSGQHACALTMQGGVLCWGSNQYGQLGNGTTKHSGQPVKVRGLDKGVRAVAMNDRLTCALTERGGVLCWGYNQNGQLGDGTKKDRSVPVPVRGLGKGVKAIALSSNGAFGDSHACALTEQGGVLCWGSNWAGQLGDGTKKERSAPVPVRGLDQGVKAIAVSEGTTCALTEQGGVLCWGSNWAGQLGDGTKEERSAPVPVRGLDKGVKAIAMSRIHVCALTEQGGVLCWGSNWAGQLGDGTEEERSAPVPVRGLDQGVKAIAVSSSHTCALTERGGVLCWGYNQNGQLGDGIKESRSAPVPVRGLDKGVKAIALSDTLPSDDSHTCALTEQGGVLCWGRNQYGQLGDGSTQDASEPIKVKDLTADVSSIVVGKRYTCALTAQGAAYCWGLNDRGQLGAGSIGDRVAAVDARGLDKGIRAVAAGDSHTCALTEPGGVLCWGRNSAGQLGDGTKEHRSTPVPVRSLDQGIKAIAAGDSHTCALTEQGGVLCWGSNQYGQLGDGTKEDRSAPVPIRSLDKGVKAIAAGYSHTCALTEQGGVLCWGRNSAGQLGDGTKEHRSAPVPVRSLDRGVEAIAAGGFHTCALTEQGSVLCWGSNSDGQLGDGTKEDRSTPILVPSLDRGVKAIAAGDSHTCALIERGGVSCLGTHWETVDEGLVINIRRVLLKAVGSSKFKAIASGSDHTCALTERGSVVCAGDNFHSQLGDGSFTFKTDLTKVTAYARPVAAIAGGDDHTCVLTTEGGVRCWGRNQYGQLGNGEFGISPTPAAVVN